MDNNSEYTIAVNSQRYPPLFILAMLHIIYGKLIGIAKNRCGSPKANLVFMDITYLF